MLSEGGSRGRRGFESQAEKYHRSACFATPDEMPGAPRPIVSTAVCGMLRVRRLAIAGTLDEIGSDVEVRGQSQTHRSSMGG
jgi:hypothetical protein